MLLVRKARPDDLPSVQNIVEEAYSPYIARIGRKPGPMLDDYARRIAAGEVEVVEGPASLDAIRHVQRSLGLAAFLRPSPVERVGRDLATYLRQPAPDAVLTEAAAHVLARPV